MLLFTLEETHVKNFMRRLLREPLFDSFQLRAAEIIALARVSVYGENENTFSTWEQMKPIVTAIIKNGPKPRYIKIVFSAGAETLAAHENAQAFFINMVYENNQITFTTACAQKQFSMDKTLDSQWDAYVFQFFKNNNLPVKREDK